MKLYIKAGRQPSIRKFIEKFFDNGRDGGTTQYMGVATYRDVECTKLHCAQNKYRSFDDLYRAVSSVYKTATPEKVFSELLQVKKGPNNRHSIHLLYCGDIKRQTMCFYMSGHSFGLARNLTVGVNQKFNYKELFKSLNIKNDVEFRFYQRNGKLPTEADLEEMRKPAIPTKPKNLYWIPAPIEE
ncbi:hypothetical protein N356_gp058 [Cellulophaga phage phi14:2]|uniref:Uncharacterized protein n=1 Tax=Cellulophaga phage phi14:2 TaxID=1327990 RepID=S0A2B8_9CAUD|nr:hypothetical protein N356_gp058 [Cellulophaga phage phi14:2]AGO48950.1 hypothetical protein Phi14:2_gp072 [Cellulophaga phage phi14:2]